MGRDFQAVAVCLHILSPRLSGWLPVSRLCSCVCPLPVLVSPESLCVHISVRVCLLFRPQCLNLKAPSRWPPVSGLSSCAPVRVSGCECVGGWGASLLSRPSPVFVHLGLCLWVWPTLVCGCVGGVLQRAWERQPSWTGGPGGAACLRAPEPISFLPSEPVLTLGGQGVSGSQVWG